jgi:hypothetical protein
MDEDHERMEEALILMANVDGSNLDLELPQNQGNTQN